MGMSLIHHIRTEEDIKILLTCPVCLKNIFEEKKQIENISKNNFQSKEIIIKEKIKTRKDYSFCCPHCKSFHMTYINLMKKKIKNVTENENSDYNISIEEKKLIE
jgi:hypothetical protein